MLPFFAFFFTPPLLLLLKSSLQEISALPFSREVLRFCGDRFEMWSYVFKIIIITIIIIIIIKNSCDFPLSFKISLFTLLVISFFFFILF